MNYFLTGTDTGVGKACRKIGFRYGQLCVFAPPREFVSPAEALRRGGFGAFSEILRVPAPQRDSISLIVTNIGVRPFIRGSSHPPAQ